MFELGDWVWVHMRKERFSNQRKSKLSHKGDGPFKVLERVNDNAYKIDLLGEYNVSATFNVADLSLFDASPDLRLNPFEEGGNDVIPVHQTTSQQDPLHIPTGPMTRTHAKRIKEALNTLVQQTWAKYDAVGPSISTFTKGNLKGLLCNIQAQLGAFL